LVEVAAVNTRQVLGYVYGVMLRAEVEQANQSTVLSRYMRDKMSDTQSRASVDTDPEQGVEGSSNNGT
jgi:DNA gyrase inhibitor GyrI